MSKKEKILERLLAKPKDFSFDELISLLGHFGYSLDDAGRTSGSRVAFTDGESDFIRLHKPHPRMILKPYQISDIIKALTERGFL